MTKLACNAQRRLTATEVASTLVEAICHRCGVTAKALMDRGEMLEVCGEEFCDDLISGETVVVPIALCPDCHRINHLDARGQHISCQIKARQSRETFGLAGS
jgi:hypothetical protein